MTVSVSVTFDRDTPPTTAVLIRGGLRVEVDGTPVADYVNADEFEWAEWGPEYKGDRIQADVGSFVDALLDVHFGAVDLYETISFPIWGLRSRYELQVLSGDWLRLAYHLPPLSDEKADEYPLVVKPECERGFLVDRDELSLAFVDAGREILAFADEMDVDWDDSLYAFAEKLDRLEEYAE